MANRDKIREILRRSVKPGKQVTEAQLNEVVGKVLNFSSVDNRTIKSLSESVVRDPDAFIIAVVDMGDINSELKKDPPKR